jgi:hypothetical protein
VFNDCVTPTFSRVGSQPTKVKKTKKKEEENKARRRNRKRSITQSFEFPRYLRKIYTHKGNVDLVCLLTGYLLSEAYFFFRLQYQKTTRSEWPSRRMGTGSCFPFSLIAYEKTKKKTK